ncbi:MAG TPA: hypothetical protein VMC41_01150 [Candidatus Nanoarchaeia archaeon]|nr:hypothetical protein [Candidatus Nanoarchaeia archaeon]
MNAKEKIEDKVGSDFASQYQDQLDHDRTRNKIICVFKEQIGTVDFANEVKKYAAEEMDKRVFRSVQYWITVILTTAITAFIAVLIGQTFK